MRGWTYIITNLAMPGLVKVGFTMKDPQLRAEELNNTGSPHPFVVQYDILVDDPQQIEQQVHKELKEFSEGKEWFRCSIECAIEAITRIAKSKILATHNATPGSAVNERDFIEGLAIGKLLAINKGVLNICCKYCGQERKIHSIKECIFICSKCNKSIKYSVLT
jgi:hypothetical protein